MAYLELLEAQATSCGWHALSYCLMTNHIHLLVRTPRPNLGAGIKRAHESFASLVNRKYREHGHLFGERFGNKLVRSDTHLLGCFRYIARNPVEAGLCELPEHWRWSAHRALAGEESARLVDVEAAMAFFGGASVGPREDYGRLTGFDDHRLLASLKQDRQASLVSAVEDFGIPVETVAQDLGISTRAVYSRLAEARVELH